ncbi:MAG TPA: gamma-glutamyl-gamma-aminobutyrate hydrolase family protein [Marisediminicola sp.]|nr:gamma-glutamyl-gamma-aminobutyrate hydrolase family protein [Marisediminicola sp.]
MNASDAAHGTATRSPVRRRPVIGLTTYLEQAQTGVWNVPASFLPKAYFDAVTRAGGIAVLLPPQPVDREIADRVLDGLDGLIITGGKDVDPARYGAPAHLATDEPRLDRDAWEHELLTRALERELPFLGICRGAQVLNVALGGTLHQHLPDLVGSTTYQAGGGVFNEVAVDVVPESRLHSILEGSPKPMRVPVYHHQAIDRLGERLMVTARTDEGIIEAVELEGGPFALAVQWHPEESTEDLRLFEGLVDAARQYREEHS